MEQETWKNIEGYEGIYLVSSLGNVKRLKYKTVGRNQSGEFDLVLPEYIFKGALNTKGYRQVNLTIGRKRLALLHRLVAEAFLEKPSKELIMSCEESGLSYVAVNHIDGDIRNNSVSNLEWCNTSHNNNHAIKLEGAYERPKGSKHSNSLLSEESVLKIVNLYLEGITQEVVGKIYGVKQITISNILTGRSWSWLTGIPYRPSNKRKTIPLAEKTYADCSLNPLQPIK